MSKFLNFLNKGSSITIDVSLLNSMQEHSIKELLIDHGVDLIAKTCAKSTIDIFDANNNKVKDDNFYKLNVRPNPNETGSTFWNRVFYKLLKENRALVVSVNDSFLLADSYESGSQILTGKTYYNVVVNDGSTNGYKFEKTFSSKDVFLFDLGSSKASKLLENFYKSYDAVISNSIRSFIKSNTHKFILNTPTNAPILKDKEGNIIDPATYANSIVSKLTSSSDEIIQLARDFSITEVTNNKQTDPTFIKAIKQFGDLVAAGLGIPLDIYWGNKTEKSQGTDDFITLACLYPLQVVEDEINSKTVSKEDYLIGNKVRFNKHTIKYRSALDISSSIDKLRAVGYSFNDIQEMLDEPTIDENWAKTRYVTKNYMEVVGKEEN